MVIGGGGSVRALEGVAVRNPGFGVRHPSLVLSLDLRAEESVIV